MLVDIYKHEHHSRLSVFEEKKILELVDTFSDILASMLFPRDCELGGLLIGGAEGISGLKARLM